MIGTESVASTRKFCALLMGAIQWWWGGLGVVPNNNVKFKVQKRELNLITWSSNLQTKMGYDTCLSYFTHTHSYCPYIEKSWQKICTVRYSSLFLCLGSSQNAILLEKKLHLSQGILPHKMAFVSGTGWTVHWHDFFKPILISHQGTSITTGNQPYWWGHLYCPHCQRTWLLLHCHVSFPSANLIVNWPVLGAAWFG